MNNEASGTESSIEITSQSSTQIGQVKVTFTVGRIVSKPNSVREPSAIGVLSLHESSLNISPIGSDS